MSTIAVNDFKRDKNLLFWTVVVLVVLTKFSIVCLNEIAALPYDSEQYVRQAATSPLAVGVPAGYPFWLMISRMTGIPQRLLIELLYLISSVVLGAAVKANFKLFPSLLMVAVLAIYPSTFFMFDHALSDGFYACLSIFALASTFKLLFSSGKGGLFLSAFTLGIELGLMAITRNEDPLLFLWGAIVVCALVSRGRLWNRDCRKFDSRSSALAVLLIFLTPVALVQTLNLAHLLSSGVYTRNLYSLPSHMNFLSKLARIETNTASIRYVPISFEARKLAYAASPTLRKFEKIVEDRQNVYHVVSRASGVPPGEVGAGWIWHVFSDAIFKGLNTGNVVVLDAEYKKINGELDSAFSNGTLKSRFVLHPFLTAPVLDVVSRMPEALLSVGQRSFNAYPRSIDQAHERDLFDELLLRRTALSGSEVIQTIQGWAFVDIPGRKISRILLTKDDKDLEVASYFERPDVLEGYSRERGWNPSVIGYRAQVITSSNAPLQVSYLLDNGEKIVNKRELVVGQASKITGYSGLEVMQGFDIVDVQPKVKNAWRQNFQSVAVAFVNSSFVAVTLLLSMFGLLLLSVLMPRLFSQDQLGLCKFCWLVATLFSLRVVFYAALNSEAWLVEVRYLLTAGLMALIVISLLIGQILSQWNSARVRPAF